VTAGILGRACSTYGGRRGAYGILVERPDGRRPLGRPRRKWDKLDGEVWTGLIWLRIVTVGGNM